MDKTKLLFEKQRITQKIAEENEFLSRLNERDRKYAIIYEKSKKFIADNLEYFEMIKIIEETIVFNSNLVDEFLNYFEAYNNINDELKQPKHDDASQNHEEHYFTINFYCPISNFLMTDPYVNTCGHSFEYSSLIEYIRTKPESKCPLCKRAINKQSISPNSQLKEIISHWQKRTFSNQYTFVNIDAMISDEEEFKNELERKKVIEEEIRQLKLNLEKKEFKLKELDQRVEKWIKKRQKNQAAKTENPLTLQDAPLVKTGEEESSISPPKPSQKYIPPPPKRPIPECPKPIIAPKPSLVSQSILETEKLSTQTILPQAPPPPPTAPLLSQQDSAKKSNDLMDDIKKFAGNISMLKKTGVNHEKPIHENKLEIELKNAIESSRKHHAISDSDSSESSGEYEDNQSF
jgi:hypothetical protein